MIIFLSFFIFAIKCEILGIDYSDEMRTAQNIRSRRVVYKINGSLSRPTILDLKEMSPTKFLSYFTIEDLSDIFCFESKDLCEKVPYLVILENKEKHFKIPSLESPLNFTALNFLFVKYLNLENNKFKCVLSKRSYLTKEQSQQLFQSFHKADYKVSMVVPESLCFLADYISALPIETEEEVKKNSENEKNDEKTENEVKADSEVKTEKDEKSDKEQKDENEKNEKKDEKEKDNNKYEGRNYLVISTRGIKSVFSMYSVKKTEKKVNFKNLFHLESEDFSDKTIKSTFYSIVEDITVTNFKKEFLESKGSSVEIPTLICYPRDKTVTQENNNFLFCDLSKIIKKIIEGIIRNDDIYKPLDIKTYNLNKEVKFVLFNTFFDLKEIKNIFLKIILEKKTKFENIKEEIKSKIENKEFKTLFCSNFVEMKMFQNIFPFYFETKYTNKDSISFGAAYLGEKHVKIQDERILYPTSDTLFGNSKSNKIIENVIKEIKIRNDFKNTLEKFEGQNLLKNFSEFSDTEIGEIIEKAKKQFSNLKEMENFISLIKNKIEENSKRIREKERKAKEIERRGEGVKQLDNLISELEKENLFADLEDLSKESISKEDIKDHSKEDISKDNTNKDNTTKDNITKDNINKENTTKENINKYNINKENINKENIIRDVNTTIPTDTSTKEVKNIGSEHLVELRDVFVSVKTWFENNKENKEIGHSEFLNQFVNLKSKHRIITTRIQRMKEEKERIEKEKLEKEKLEKEEKEKDNKGKDNKEKEKDNKEKDNKDKEKEKEKEDIPTLPSEENEVLPPFNETPSFEKTEL
ncbi:hypothetical protein CWI37_1443p0010 [Hamiltosporidium tvaerminnensis]|uniref:Uncharacterized protein n=1 Tax=Hamiltosporidium tvaerminnensis TaxID=1176355 RepID=A0A4Q9KW71_9MICR|nr:hypothetical protein LUQ84_001348 [Hamiltosporidium tvaerminnensis]TBT99152.1 hypothetical protein CWI37_1443p0010 [Hamiltosporidium tvaerminnensis]